MTEEVKKPVRRKTAAKKKTAERKEPARKTGELKNRSLIGVDPLAWLNEEASDDTTAAQLVAGPVVEETESVEAVADSSESETITSGVEAEAAVVVEAGADAAGPEEMTPEDVPVEASSVEDATESMPDEEINASAEEQTDMQNEQEEPQVADASGDSGAIILDAVQTIGTVSELYARFNTLLETDQPIVVDCDQVESIDAASLQLLLALSLEMQNRGKSLEFSNTTQEFVQTVELMGMKNELLQGVA